MENKITESIAILGGGPSGLFMLKSLLENWKEERSISIFEKKKKLGSGMPYSNEGANREHITNVSANEIPELVTSVNDWLQSVPEEVLSTYGIDQNHFNEYKVLPRLLFGSYLEAQFELLLLGAERAGIHVNIHLESDVDDIADIASENVAKITLKSGEIFTFSTVIICTGHNWPRNYEGKIEGYFDSPYPPSKLQFTANHAVAIKGASLTAIDAIRTLARHNGTFFKTEEGKLKYERALSSPKFNLVMHSRSGLLPAVRFHLEDSHLGNKSLLTEREIEEHKAMNDGFLSLDFLFENDFKKILVAHDPELYELVMGMSLEEFTTLMIESREKEDAFVLLSKEYENAEKSIKRKESIYWKELLGVLSFALNYPAKYLSAEDMLRLQKSLMPLISVVIAYVPQASACELLALHESGVLKIVSVGNQSSIEIDKKVGVNYHYIDEEGKQQSNHYKTFVDCVGQPHLSFDAFPFKGLLDGSISPAILEFQSENAAQEEHNLDNKNVIEKEGRYVLSVPGITINDTFQIVGEDGKANKRIYIMAVPYIGGYNPDYSGLDFCEEASGRIAKALLK